MNPKKIIASFFISFSLLGSLFSYSQPMPKFDEDMMTVLETCGPLIPLSLNEVIQNTVALRPRTGIQIEDVRIQSGRVQQNAGPFDWVADFQFSQNTLTDVFFLGFQQNLDGKISRGTLRGRKKYRIGTEMAVRVDAESVNNPGDFFFQRFSNAVVTFTAVQPALRGFKFGEDTITELASQYELQAVYYDSLFNISNLIRGSLIAYWNVVRSQQLLKILRESVASFEELASNVQRLIDEDQLARTQINQPLAQLASEQINLKLAEQRLYSDVQALKIAMGTVDTHCFSDSLLYAVHPFPEVERELDVCKLMKCLSDYAVKNRLDRLASEIRIEELAVLVKGAENQTLPRLDFFYEFVMTQFKRDQRSRFFFSSFDFPNPQRDNAVGVIFSYPICNNAAKGLFRRLKAEWRKQELSTEELSQQIVAEVMEAWMDHIRLQQELKRATESVERFQQLVDDENTLLKEGIGSLFNLVDFQTRLTRAQTEQIQIKRNLAENLANLHFFTGTLIRPDSSLCSINVENVTDIPLAEQSE
jgi:outer membrane protein